jgi:hypothetical protein
MKVYSWSSVVEFFTRRMFIVDKHGRIIFFPWGIRGKGYILKNVAMKEKTANFYTSCVIAYLLGIGFLAGRFQNFLGIIGLLLISGSILLLTWYVYSWNITRYLSITRASYKEIVLDKVTSDSEKFEDKKKNSNTLKISKNYLPPSIKSDPFLRFKAIYYGLSAGQLFADSLFAGLTIGLIWTVFHSQSISGKPEEWLIAFLVAFFFGLSGFFMVSRSETSGFMEFIFYKLSFGFFMGICWLGALFFLYKFFVH